MILTTTFSAALALTLAQAPAAPVQPPSTSGMVLKGKAPVSNEVLKVTLPKPQEADLPNGVHLIVLEDHRLPQVTFQIIIPGAGGYYDPEGQTGLASFTASLMREGTRTKTSPQLSEALERIAATLSVNSGVSSPQANMSGSALTEHFGTLMDLAADVLLNPAFAPEEWDRFKVRTKSQLLQQRTNPSFLAQEAFSRVAFGTHPAGRVSPTVASIDAITPLALAEFHRTHYVPDFAAMAFAGDISLADARKLVETKLAGWKKSGVKPPAVTDPGSLGAQKIYLVARPGSVQTTFIIGTQSMKRTDPDYEALTVANRVLGGVMGRLFRHLREEKGYTYGIYSSFTAPLHRGSWVASTNVRTEVTEPALKDLLAEIAELRDKPIPSGELSDTERSIVAGFALSLENPQSVLSYYIDTWTYRLPADYWDTYPARIGAITPAQAQAAAKKYLQPDRLRIVAVGDATKIADILAKNGDVEMYDTDGKPLAVKTGTR